MSKPCLLSLCAELEAVSMFFFPIWSLLPQFHSERDVWHGPALLLMEELAIVGQVKWVRSLRKDLAVLT